jgi:hypothetical protein
MSTLAEIDHAVEILGAVSTYPAPLAYPLAYQLNPTFGIDRIPSGSEPDLL